MEKVIYCVLSCMASLGNVPHTVLFQSTEGAVVTVSNSQLLNLRIQYPDLPIIYFSPVAFQQKTVGLSPADIQTVVQKRVTDWSPQLLDQVPYWLYQQQQQLLALIARYYKEHSQQREVQASFSAHLSWLTQCTNEGRYDGLTLNELLVALLEKESLLKTELEQAQTQLPNLGVDIQEHQQAYQAVSHFLAAHGQPEFSQGPLYSELWRAVYITPADDVLRKQLQREFEHFVPWQEGLVSRWRVRRLTDLQHDGRRAVVLYRNANRFIEDAHELTDAQLKVTFTRRMNSNGIQPLNDYLNELRLELLLLWQAVLERCPDQPQATQEQLAAIAHNQIARFLVRLGQEGSWLEGYSDRSVPKEALLASEQFVADDLAFFVAIAQQQQRPDLVNAWTMLAASQRVLASGLK